MRAIGVRLILYGSDGQPLADTFAPVNLGRGLNVQEAAADSLKQLREAIWPSAEVSRTEVEIEVVEEIGPGRYRYKVLDKIDDEPTHCIFQCLVNAWNPVFAKTIGAFHREDSLREAAII